MRLRFRAHDAIPRLAPLVVLVSVAGATLALAQGPASVTSLLDLYASGQFDRAATLAIDPRAQSFADLARSVANLQKNLEKVAPAWAAAKGPAQLAQRRLIASTFTIDVAHGVYRGLQNSRGLGPEQALAGYGGFQFVNPARESSGPWPALDSLMEWACSWLRSAPVADPLEQNWFLASVQLSRDFYDPAVAIVQGAGVTAFYNKFPGHLGHAASRFPALAWFRVVSAERQAKAEEFMRRRQTLSNSSLGSFATRPSVGQRVNSQEAAARQDLEQIRHVLTPLESDVSVRAEVHVHLGCVAILCGQHDEARRYLSDIDPWTTNRCLRYLGHYLQGWVDELDGRPADAELAYAAATEILPQAESGLMALGVLKAQDGDQAEAARLAGQAAAAPRSALDPWVELNTASGCTQWDAFMAPLHEGIRRWSAQF